VCKADVVIVGVGIDLVDVARFEKALRRTPPLEMRLLTEHERNRSIASMAGRFAAKEALAKALGAPAGLRWLDAEIRSGRDGRPWLETRGSVAMVAKRLGVRRWHVSISHDGGMVLAVVVAEA
jgi:holo-[acyl-carrier protein] synthase